MVELGLIAPYPEQSSFERVQHVQELAFVPLPDMMSGDS